jgi:hypothetical protein
LLVALAAGKWKGGIEESGRKEQQKCETNMVDADGRRVGRRRRKKELTFVG